MAGVDGSLQSQPHTARAAEYLEKHYKLGRTLGSGSFGKVKLAEHILTGQKVAIKILNRKKIESMDMEEKVRREIKISALFHHPHVIRLYEVITTPVDIFVVIEYVKGGELFDYIVEKQRLMEDEARHFFQQIICGLEYCHRKMVVHRDLKPENLLLETASKVVKIADFGLSNVMRDGHFLKTSCGSPNYAAPEVISGRLYAGPEVDVWSCGVILYALLCGSLPFDDENIPNLFKKIKHGMYTLPPHLSPGARDLIPRMLQVDPLRRITIHEVRQHPWFNLNLPRYLAVMQAEPVGGVHIDAEVMQQCIRYGFDRPELEAALKSHQTTRGTVTYHLVLDHKAKLTSNAYLAAEMVEGGQQRLNPCGIMSPQSNPDIGGPARQQAQRAASLERLWRLGVRTVKRPQLIYADLHAAFAELNILWKRTGPYNFRCKTCLMQPTRQRSGKLMQGVDAMEDDASMDLNSTVPRAVKFEVQIYRVRPQQYLIDIQRIEGHLYLFFDIASELVRSLSYRSHAAMHHSSAMGVA